MRKRISLLHLQLNNTLKVAMKEVRNDKKKIDLNNYWLILDSIPNRNNHKVQKVQNLSQKPPQMLKHPSLQQSKLN